VERPSGTVTFLFTDVEGSTRRWEAGADEMRAEMALHDAALQSTIAARDGWVFKRTGDGVCAAFSSPRAAVDAAIAAQRVLRLPVRMGLATGEVELRGDDYFGLVVNRAARLMAAGHGGQVLLVGATAELISGVELLDLGPRQLRDFSEPVRVFQARAEGLRAEFPPLRSVDEARGNLRAHPTSFVGRTRELAELEQALRSGRLVTLTGPGGVGKTRLALQLAAQVAADFPDGVWVAELAAVGDPAAVPDAVATVLGMTQQAGMTVAESVAAALAGRRRLLVLDNCEHLLDAVADLCELILARSVTVKVVATSREGLRLAEEHLWPVPPLPVRGTDSEGVALFVERARAVVPGFAASGPDDATAVEEICRRVDGIPLAIELAASRMVSMSPQEVRDHLHDRFRLLSGSRRGLERHQTLRQAVQWSYDLLDDGERALLNRCSVFAGGFDLAAAVAVGGDGPLDEFAVLDVLDALVRKSLLVAERSSEQTRLTMLETIRQFAEEQLSLAGESASVRDLHCSYYAGQEAGILALWDGPGQARTYQWIDLELANLRSGFRWATDRGDIGRAASIAALASFTGYWCQRYEPGSWAEELLGAARDQDDARLAVLLAIASQHAGITGRPLDGVVYAEEAEALFPDPRYISGWFGQREALLGGAYVYVGRPERFVELCQRELAHSDDPLAMTRSALVYALALAGRSDEASVLAGEVVAVAESTTNPYLLSNALLGQGFARRDSDPLGALEALRRGRALAQGSGNRTLETHAKLELARLEAAHGDGNAALALLAEAITEYHDSGDTSSLRSPLAVLVAFLDRAGRYETAATIAGLAVSPLTTVAFPEISASITHLRDVLGTGTVDTLARRGQAMDTAAIVRYSLEQIEQALAAR
jgi:predicted ATPase